LAQFIKLTRFHSTAQKAILTLNYQKVVAEKIQDEFEQIENENGQILYEQFKTLFDKNPRYNILKQYNTSSNGINDNLKIDPVIISCYKQCSITSVNVELHVFTTKTHIK